MSDTERIGMMLVSIDSLGALDKRPIDSETAQQIVLDYPHIFPGYNQNDDFHINWGEIADHVNSYVA